jgi:predicted phosphoribosyltransferase
MPEKPYFEDRGQAAALLAEKLKGYRGKRPLILAVPRGGVPMGKIIAGILQGDLDVILAHKVGMPGNPEFALGAVGENGFFYEAPHARSLGHSKDSLQVEIQRQMEALKERRKLYTSGREKARAAGRIVILVDDGIATASTLMAAMRELRGQGPLRVVVAAGVASEEAAKLLRQEADELAILAIPPDFKAVSEFFADFSQVTEEEVIQTLREFQSGS